MFYLYSKFELKILLLNRKQLLLGLVLILFFPLYFQVYLNSEPPTLYSQKYAEAENQSIIVNSMPLDLRESEEGTALFENYTEQLALVNMQIYYLVNKYGRENSEYIERGLRLNDLRMEMHEQDNPHVSSNLIVPIVEIDKENQFLQYLIDHNLQEKDNPFVTSQYLIAATKMLSGVFLFVIILLFCSDMLVYENEHQTVLRALPVSFTTKAISKVTLYFTSIMLSLFISLLLGIWRSSHVANIGDFSYPTLIYTNDGFIAVSILKYVGYVSLAVTIATLMVVCLTLLLNILVKNMYGVALAGLGFFFLPDLLYLIGIKAKFLYPIKYIDVSGVLSGNLALQFGDPAITYWHSIISMIGFTLLTIAFMFIYNWYSFKQKNIMHE